MTILFCNNGTTTVAGSINNTDTTLRVAANDGTLFPQPTGGDYFVATFYKNDTSELNEIVHCTARNGDALTIVRAQEGTQAQLWNPGDSFCALITAAALNHFLQQPDGLNTSELYDGTDVGVANHINVPAVVPAAAAGPQNGMAVVITVNAPNNGPVDVVMLGLAALPLVDGLGRPLQGGELVLGQRILVVNTSNAAYQMMNFEPLLGQRVIHVGDDISTNVNHVVATVSPIPPAPGYAPGMQFNVRVKNSNTGPIDAAFAGYPAMPCLKTDGTQCVKGDVIANQEYVFIFNAANYFQIIGPGSVGVAGPQGPVGNTGPLGPQGPVGQQGAPGNPGPQGNPGTPGAPGTPGQQGVQGKQGNPGVEGPPGATGGQGPGGPQGPQGGQGAQGPQGPSGGGGWSGYGGLASVWMTSGFTYGATDPNSNGMAGSWVHIGTVYGWSSGNITGPIPTNYIWQRNA